MSSRISHNTLLMSAPFALMLTVLSSLTVYGVAAVLAFNLPSFSVSFSAGMAPPPQAASAASQADYRKN
jgi:hypothetical protein